MSDAISSEEEISIEGRSREEMLASEAAVTKITIEIEHDTLVLLERVVEGIIDFMSPLVEVLAELCQVLYSLVSEDHKTLLEFSTGILMVNWLVCNALSPLMENMLPTTNDIDPTMTSRSKLLFKFMGILNITLADLDIITNHHQEENTTFIVRDETDVGDGRMKSSFSALTDFVLVGSEMLGVTSPAAVIIFGPLTVMILTCIIADKKYCLFATLFAPMVDRVLSSIRSLCAFITPNYHGSQHRTIPDEEEIHNGVLWGMIVLFFLESLLVGSIVVIMVLISLSLTILASISTVLSPKENPEMLEEVATFLVGFLFSWVICVVTTNVLRMALFQIYDDD